MVSKKSKFTLCLLSMFFVFTFIFASQVWAATAKKSLLDRLRTTGERADLVTSGGGEQQLANTVGGIISVFLGFLGLIGLVIVIYAGFLWLTAGGNEEKVTTAKDLLKNGVIGLVIISLAYAITSFVITQIISSGQP